ncbi:MAG: hypothetical protein D6735_01160 [Acidobacteria bacterium]|jgi:hypothetical protein|nr:MAG: hypothetical protein D6735_01160 [Acidobacteriota bacterium]
MTEANRVGKNLRVLEASDRPVITAVSWGDVRRLSRLQMLYQYHLKEASREGGSLESLDLADEVMNKIQAEISKRIVYMPRDWLVEEAPEELDFRNDPNAIEWVRADKFEKLVALVAGQEAASEAKKS